MFSETALRDAAKRGRLLRANGKALIILNQMIPRPFVLRLSKHALRICRQFRGEREKNLSHVPGSPLLTVDSQRFRHCSAPTITSWMNGRNALISSLSRLGWMRLLNRMT